MRASARIRILHNLEKRMKHINILCGKILILRGAVTVFKAEV